MTYPTKVLSQVLSYICSCNNVTATVAAPLATTSVEAAEVFTDVAGVSSWAGSAIDYLKEKVLLKV
ncbi:hypothetical protein KHA80_11700 [Anaerobacillus sp. HL2]|nr:hypothetical protein KHA80_11700 [Anaerobacillus sp. HL2]